MDNSAYTPPGSDLEFSNNRNYCYKLFDLQSIGIATFFGSLLAGGVVMAINFKNMGRSDHALTTIVCSLIATAILFALVFFVLLDSEIPRFIIVVPQVLLTLFCAKTYQGKSIDKHKENGGKLYSRWLAFLIGVITIVVILIVTFLALLGYSLAQGFLQ